MFNNAQEIFLAVPPMPISTTICVPLLQPCNPSDAATQQFMLRPQLCFKDTFKCFLLFCAVFVPFGYFWRITKSPNFAIKSARDPLDFFTWNKPAQAEFDPSGKNARFCFSLILLLVDKRIQKVQRVNYMPSSSRMYWGTYDMVLTGEAIPSCTLGHTPRWLRRGGGVQRCSYNESDDFC